MRCLFASILFIAGCDLASKETNLPIQSAFLPSACVYSQTLTNDPRFTSLGIAGPVAEYDCALYAKMNCKAYSASDEHLALECEAIDASDPQGAPGGCSETATSPNNHGFLDGSVELARNYRCGALNGNLTCGYYYFSGPGPKEEIRCHLNE